MGLDFHCELRENPAFEFWVQAKGSDTPTYRRDAIINSLSVDRHTIENYWLKKTHPVFIFMSDTREMRTYFLPVTTETYQPRDNTSNTHVFSIPLENEITRENVGNFVAEVVRLQPPFQLNTEDAIAWIEDYRQKHPLFHQNVDQIETFLEIMRGEDQSAQVEAKFVIKELFEARRLDSQRLVNGLIGIFRNRNDRISQIHVLDALVFLQAKKVIPDVIKQIDRTLKLQAYKTTPSMHRYSFTSFLFSALVKLEARDILPYIKKYLQHSEPHIVHQAVTVCGDLKLKGGARVLLNILDHPDSNVRIVTARALSGYGFQYIIQKCVQILWKSGNVHAIHGAIYTLAYFGNREHIQHVVKFIKHDKPDIRQAIGTYLGVVNAIDYADLLIELMIDRDLHVRSQAARSFIDKLDLENIEKEKLVLPKLEDAFNEGQEISVDSLLGVIQRCGSEASIPLLVRIYKEDDGILKNHRTIDGERNARGIKPIDLKTQVLGVLKKYDVPEIHEDIIHQINHVNDDVLIWYINVAEELGLTAAFDAIVSIADDSMLKMLGRVGHVLVELDKERASEWAISKVNSAPSLPIFLVCCTILGFVQLEERYAEIILKQLERLFRDPDNRIVSSIYSYLRRYKVVTATPIIIEDLNAGRFGELEEKQVLQLIRQMLQTLAEIGGKEGRDYLIALLSEAPGFKIAILNLLAKIADDPSMRTIKNSLNDPDYHVRVAANRLLEA